MRSVASPRARISATESPLARARSCQNGVRSAPAGWPASPSRLRVLGGDPSRAPDEQHRANAEQLVQARPCLVEAPAERLGESTSAPTLWMRAQVGVEAEGQSSGLGQRAIREGL